eukprot:403371311
MPCETSSTLQFLRYFVEIIEETVGLEKMKDYYAQLMIVLDTMIDFGYPSLTEKSVLVNMLQKSGVLDKASNAITGSVSDKQSLALLNHLQQLGNNPNALWRCNPITASTSQGGSIIASNIESDEKKLGLTSGGFTKDCYVDMIEYAQCVFNERGEIEQQEISGQVQVDTRIQGGKVKLGISCRFNQELDDYVIHKSCDNKQLTSVGNHEFSHVQFTPPQGKFNLLKYTTKPYPIQLPFNLKANYQNDSQSCSLDLRFERFQIGREKDGKAIYPLFEQLQIKIHFPEQVQRVDLISFREVESATMTSLPEGTFNFDEKEKTGDWTINSFQNAPQSTPQDTQIRLTGNFKLRNCTISDLGAGIVAEVNAKIKDYSFTGSKIDKIICSQTGNMNKDDPSIFRGVKNIAYAKNIEYRL